MNDLDLTFLSLDNTPSSLESWKDSSWGNDSSPSFTKVYDSEHALLLTIDYPLIAERDAENENRFWLRIFECEIEGEWYELSTPTGEESVLYEGNDMDELKRVIENNDYLNYIRTAFAP